MSTQTTRKWLASALAFGALAVPASGASIYDNGIPDSTTPSAVGDDHARTDGKVSFASTTGTSIHDNGIPGPAATQATSPVATPSAVGDDHARTDGKIAVTSAARTPLALSAPSSSSDGFDWTEAGIGFGAAAGLALLAGGSFSMTRRGRRQSIA